MLATNLEKVLGYNPKTSLNKIYALCDYETLQKKSISFETFISIVEKLDIKIIQYRDKISNYETKKKNPFADDEYLWKSCIQKLGNNYKIWANSPSDPILN